MKKAATVVYPYGYENLVVGLFALSGGIAALDMQAAFFLMPFIAPELKLDNLQIGLVGTAGLFAWSLSGFLAGPLVDRMGRRKPLLIVTFVLFALFSVGTAIATTFAMFIVARILVGVAQGPVVPVELAIVHAVSSPHRLGLNMGLSQNFGAQLIGSLLGPLLLVAVAERYGWRDAFLMAAVPGLLVALLISLLVREPLMPPRPSGEHESLARQVAVILAPRDVRLCLVIGSCTLAWYFVQLSFLPLYLTKALGITPIVMSRIITSFGIAGLISAALAPALSDRIGRRRVIAGFAALAAIAPVGMMLAGSNPWLLGGAVFVGCFIIGTIPISLSTVPIEAVGARYATIVTGAVIGLTQMVGGIAGPIAGGMLADSFGLSAVLWLSVALASVASVTALLLSKRSSINNGRT